MLEPHSDWQPLPFWGLRQALKQALLAQEEMLAHSCFLWSLLVVDD